MPSWSSCYPHLLNVMTVIIPHIAYIGLCGNPSPGPLAGLARFARLRCGRNLYGPTDPVKTGSSSFAVAVRNAGGIGRRHTATTGILGAAADENMVWTGSQLHLRKALPNGRQLHIGEEEYASGNVRIPPDTEGRTQSAVTSWRTRSNPPSRCATNRVRKDHR